MQINEEKRKKFMEFAGKRVNNVLHDIQILEPMSRSSSYDFTRQDVEEMFNAMQETLNNTRAEFERKFEEKARSEKKTFSFGSSSSVVANVDSSTEYTTTSETYGEVSNSSTTYEYYSNSNTNSEANLTENLGSTEETTSTGVTF